MTLVHFLLLLFLVVCAFFVGRTKDLISAVIVFSAYSLTMALLWQQLASPDVAITEAAIGSGVTTLLLFAAISRTRRME
ncbi:MAG: DUF4040 domain-containing protein [Bacillota bacterium]|jgi:energy-converting hydrogenase B subunit D|nr:DUF4040 domain-containing protein [Bacillota bacterium]NLJ04026.1 DUF4040 domain-containing protein [Bacillota bacterium]